MTGAQLLVGPERAGWVSIDPAAGRGAYFPDAAAALAWAGWSSPPPPVAEPDDGRPMAES